MSIKPTCLAEKYTGLFSVGEGVREGAGVGRAVGESGTTTRLRPMKLVCAMLSSSEGAPGDCTALQLSVGIV